jgi:release factor glutamine methyltransferase
MPDSEAWTVGRLLTWTTDYLKRQGASSPRLDAEVLLAEALHCRRIELYTAFNDPVADDVRSVFRELVRRRAAGEPVAYLVGHREFYSLSFAVTSDVLIPRPETEHLVVQVLELLRDRPAEPPPRVVDVGTGSGAIVISVARHAPACRLTAVDISEAALAVARRNARQHDVAERIDFLVSDLLEALPPQPAFDLVVSNPPYVSQAEWERLGADVRDHEPKLALVAGSTGTETIVRLVSQAAPRLRAGGWLLMEISPMIEPAVRDILQQQGDYQQPSTAKDLAGLARVVAAQRKP